MRYRYLLFGWLVWSGCGSEVPADTDGGDRDNVVDTDDAEEEPLSGFGVYDYELWGELETVRFDLAPPAIDPCPGCEFAASVVDADGDFGAHIGWDPIGENLFLDTGDGNWQLFRSALMVESNGGTWTASSGEGELEITSRTPWPGYDYCEVEAGDALESPPAVSAVASGTIDCDTSNIDAYIVAMNAGDTIDLHLTAAPGNDPFLMLGNGDCIMGLFDDGLPCAEGDASRFCSAATFTAPEDMTLEVFVEWYDCLPEGMNYDLGVGGDITALPEAETYPLPTPYWDPDATTLTETIDLRWINGP
jgi:hypothetical protein